jgi:hypothetical protein
MLNISPLYIDIKKTTKTLPIRSPINNKSERNDIGVFNGGRERNVGFKIGQYLQSAPMLFTRDRHALYLGDIYRGRTCFLIGGGPSFAKVDKEKLNQAGFLTMGVNNSVKTFRPHLWCCVDDPTHFIKSIWLDPKIMKFVPFSLKERCIFDNEEWKDTTIKVGDCPNMFFYARNELFQEEQFLFEDSINWGNHSKWGGGRSVLFAATRLLFYLGIRNVFLLGVDLKMDEQNKYHFDQDREKGSIKSNNSTYEKIKERFKKIKPIFDKNNFNIYNCNFESELKVFPFVSFDDAIQFATSEMPKDLSKERTSGLYERTAKIKKEKENIDNTKTDIIIKEIDEEKKELVKYEFDTFNKEQTKEILDKKTEMRNKIKEKKDILNKIRGKNG